MMVSGFIKSTIGTILISGGTTVFVAPFVAPPGVLPDHTALIGIVFLMSGFIVYYAGDIYQINKNKDIEVERLKKAEKIVDTKIKDERSRLAEEVKENALLRKEEIDRETDLKLDTIRRGLCTDISKISGDNNLTYCNLSEKNPHLKYVRYPDSVDPMDIIGIGIKKLEDRNKTITTKDLVQYFNDLYDSGLISRIKLDECLNIIEGEDNA